jgi:hypothetical protein
VYAASVDHLGKVGLYRLAAHNETDEWRHCIHFLYTDEKVAAYRWLGEPGAIARP